MYPGKLFVCPAYPFVFWILSHVNETSQTGITVSFVLFALFRPYKSVFTPGLGRGSFDVPSMFLRCLFDVGTVFSDWTLFKYCLINGFHYFESGRDTGLVPNRSQPNPHCQYSQVF